MAEEEGLSPYASYNKPGPAPKGSEDVHGVPTLVGNWVEERAQAELTGVARYEPGVAIEPDAASLTGTSIFATRAHNPTATMPTFPRVIEHIEQTAPVDWKSMQQVSYLDPKKPTVGGAKPLVEFTEAARLGPRARMELEMLKAEAANLPPDVEHTLTGAPIPDTLETTYRGHFVDKDPTAGGLNTFGARIMHDHDGRPAVRDPTFLAETQIVPRQLADRVFGETARVAGATQTMTLPNPDVPITLYSEAVATRKYGGTVYGTRPVPGTLPFNKNTNFSKPMSCYDKVVIDE